MSAYTQAERPLILTTPLGKDAVLLREFNGHEGVSQLFGFQLDLMAPEQASVAFEKVLGQPALIELEMGKDKRHFHGILSRISQGGRDATFIRYRAELVPQFWLWTKKSQSRIFQHLSVPDILKQVLQGLDVSYQIQGSFQPRDYCVQYRESDFAFASRLMEEEGIYYFFKHSAGGHTMVVANTPQGHPDVPLQSQVIYEEIAGAPPTDLRITDWEKIQELRSGKVTLWDHCFELPHQHLEAEQAVQESVAAGKVNHKLKVGNNDRLEIYDYPGAYAQRFDGIDSGGGERDAVSKIFEDNKRTVAIRMQQEALPSLLIQGTSNCRQFTGGHKFTLERHFNADGAYLLTRVEHSATLGTNYRSGQPPEFLYTNRFQCVPMGLPYRPPRRTPRPTVQGTQTAVVVGPAGEEIFTDKYSRVKVQFHWDRAGKNNADSSCWVRVGTLWAGKQWGVIHIPRIGQEVIVDFLEGDPDQPIIVGSVYNAEQMPPYGLPGSRTQSGIKSNSSLGGGGSNEMRFEDSKGAEQVYIHAQKNQDIVVENDETHSVGHDRTKTIGHDETTLVKHDRTETVDNNETITVHGARTETVDKDETITIHQNRTETVDKNETITVTMMRTRLVGINESVTVGAAQEITVGAMRAVTVGAMQTITVGAAQTITVGGNETETYGKNHTQTVAQNQTVTVGKGGTYKIAEKRATEVGQDDALKVGKVLAIDAGERIVLKTGDAMIDMKKDGTIIIKGKDITIRGSGEIDVKSDKDITMKGQNIKEN